MVQGGIGLLEAEEPADHVAEWNENEQETAGKKGRPDAAGAGSADEERTNARVPERHDAETDHGEGDDRLVGRPGR